MPKEMVPVTVEAFKGLNLSISPDKIEDNEFQILENVLLNKDGLSKRGGFDLLKRYSSDWKYVGKKLIKLNDTTYIMVGNNVTGDIEYTDDFFATVTNGNVSATHTINFGEAVETTGTEFIFPAQRVSDNKIGIVFLDYGLNAVWFVELPGLLSSADIKSIFVHASRLWVVSLHKIYYSEPESFGGFPAENTIEKSTTTLSFTNGFPLPDRRAAIFAGSDLKILNLSGSPKNWSFDTIHTSSNLVSRALLHKGVLYFFSDDGFYALSGTNLVKFSSKLDKILDDFSGGFDPFVFLYDNVDNILFLQIIMVMQERIAPEDRVRSFLYYLDTGEIVEFKYNYLIQDGSDLYSFFNLGWPGLTDRHIPIYFDSVDSTVNRDGDLAISGAESGRIIIALDEDTLDDDSLVFLTAFHNNEDDNYQDSCWDGVSAEEVTPVVTKLRTKEYNFGEFASLKKIQRVTTLTDLDVDIEFTYTINKDYIPKTPQLKTLSSGFKYSRLPGPGFFKSFSFELEDDSTDGWTLLSFNMDVFRHPEITKASQ